MASPLADLDELVLKCRDEKSKQYIREAVSCYKSGAFRSAIVSTWIAVTFDILDKIKELALSGDKEAENQLETFEKARRQNDITNALKFEREILGIAQDKLELISHIECLDLERLKQDRDRCAHPSMTSEGEIFNPPAELARVHIRNAVEYVLQYPPAQGKYALDNLLSEVDSEYFPNTPEKALIALQKSPLLKARTSLVRNFIIVMLKKLISDTDGYEKTKKYIGVLKATEIIHKEIYDNVLSEKLSDLIKSLKDDKLNIIGLIVRQLSEYWVYINNDVKQRLENYVESLPSIEINRLDDFLEFKPLQLYALKRFGYITKEELSDLCCWGTSHSVRELSIKLFLAPNSHQFSIDWGRFILENASDYSLDQVKRIIEGISLNDQVVNSRKIRNMITAFKQNRKLNQTIVENLIEENNLQKYMNSKNDEYNDF